jgi:hypothetical protein
VTPVKYVDGLILIPSNPSTACDACVRPLDPGSDMSLK